MLNDKNKMIRRLRPEELLLMVSGAVFVLFTTPAWYSGMVAAVIAAAVLALLIFRMTFPPEKIRQLLSSPGMLCVAALIVTAYGVNFYNTWLDSRYVEVIARLAGMDMAVFLYACTCLAGVLSLPAVTCVVSGAVSLAAGDFAEKRNVPIPGKADGRSVPAGRAVLILFAVYVIGFSAVLRTNFYYMDDNGRAAFGYKTWDYFGRYLSTGFSSLIHMGDYLTDIAPLPQLTALLIMAVSGVLLLYIFFDRTLFTLWELAAVVPLGLNPYFLECLSFRFDAPYMAVSVLAGILPLLYRNQRTWIYLLSSMLGILAVCTSYQAGTGIFPLLVVALALRMFCDGRTLKEALCFGLRSAAGYGLGLVYFKLVIMKPADAGYVSNAMPEAAGFVSNMLGNYKRFFGLILTDFKPFWLLLMGLLAVLFLVLSVYRARQGKAAAGLVAAVSLAAMLLLCFGLYPVLESPLYAPRAMYGFGVLLTVLCIVTAEGQGNVPVKMPALILSWTFFVFSFTYGNALDLQKQYTEFRIQMVMEDLNDLDVFAAEETVLLRLEGGIGDSPIYDNMPQDSNILDRLVPSTFGGGDDLTEYRFWNYYGLRDVAEYGSLEDCPADMPVLKDGIFHTIRGEGNRILVVLKE